MRTLACVGLLAALWFAGGAMAQDTRFAYIGVLQDGADPAPTGAYDLRVRLFDGADGAAAQLADDSLHDAVAVEAGVFTLTLDFGDAVLAPEAWLELAVRPAGAGGFEVLAPRQRLHGVPTALYAESTDWSGVANRPAGFADGVDDDALGALGCADGDVPMHSAAGWTCSAPPLAEHGLGVLNGQGPPAAGLGRDGEFYIDTSVHAIYGPRSAGAWGPPTSLVGPPGPGPDDGNGDLQAMGTAQFLQTGQVIQVYGFTLSMQRMVHIAGTGNLQLGPPELASLELVLDPQDHGSALFHQAGDSERGTVRLRLASGAMLLEAYDALVAGVSLQPHRPDRGALAVVALEAAALELQWSDDSFGWAFRDEFGQPSGDGPDEACNDLFGSFGHAAPAGFEGIPLLGAPVAVDVSREVFDNGQPSAIAFSPLLLEFALEAPSAATVARPTCAANLLVHDDASALATSLELFDHRGDPAWRTTWTKAVAQSMSITGTEGEVRIQLALLPQEDVCHGVPDGPEICLDPTPNSSVAPQ